MFVVKIVLRDGIEEIVHPPFDHEHETADRWATTLRRCQDVASAEVMRLEEAEQWGVTYSVDGGRTQVVCGPFATKREAEVRLWMVMHGRRPVWNLRIFLWRETPTAA